MPGGYAISNRGRDALIAWLIAEPTLRGVELGLRYGHGIRSLIIGNDLPGTVEALLIESVTNGAVPIGLWEIEIEDDAACASSSQDGDTHSPRPAAGPAGSPCVLPSILSPLPAYLGERAFGPVAIVEQLDSGGVDLRLSATAIRLDESTAHAVCERMAGALGRKLGARS